MTVKVPRKELDASNVYLNNGLKVLMGLNLGLGEMRYVSDLDKRIKAVRIEYDKLKRKKAETAGATIDERGQIIFPDGKEEDAVLFETELKEYFDEEEDLGLAVKQFKFKPEYNLTANILKGIDSFIKFVD